ncbi:hypothetical protein [Shimia aestuarii]|uniref:hypothetical protein n=1 Tax=Shimia aestuarii TaxID=254406 RepID=UPI001FB24072|nr:hypothetical protein [Shimia aestuarii]
MTHSQSVTGFDISWKDGFAAGFIRRATSRADARASALSHVSGMEAEWPKPLAGSVHDSPLGQKTVNYCGQAQPGLQTLLKSNHGNARIGEDAIFELPMVASAKH